MRSSDLATVTVKTSTTVTVTVTVKTSTTVNHSDHNNNCSLCESTVPVCVGLSHKRAARVQPETTQPPTVAGKPQTRRDIHHRQDLEDETRLCE